MVFTSLHQVRKRGVDEIDRDSMDLCDLSKTLLLGLLKLIRA
jgi:hypothetical protein